MDTGILSVGFVQYAIRSGDPAANTVAVERHVREVLRRGARLVLLPEMYLGGPKKASERAPLARLYRRHVKYLAELVRRTGGFLYGSVVEEAGGAFYNTAVLISPEGRVRQVYRKKRLFRHEGEHRLFSAGTTGPLIKTPWGRAAPLICYDLRFPELLRERALRGAEMAWICAQWPAARRDHWLALLRARAIENQMFVIACNRTGDKGAIHYSGDSCLISPWGEVRLRLPEGVSRGVGTIELAEVRTVRRRYRFLRDAVNP